MAYNGSGVFSRLYSWVTDRNNSIAINAGRMDAEMDGFATGLSNCITKDGQTTITAAIPFNDKKITGLGDATADADALNRRTGDARYLELDGTGTMTGPVLAVNGTVSAPGVTFGSDTDSGLYRIGANNIGAAVNGAKVLDIATTGLGVTGTLSASAGVSGTTGAFSGAVSGTTGTFSGAITMQSRAVDAFPSGTKMLFQQTSAPTGWTKDTTHNDKALRVVSGTVGSGGSTAFSTVFAARTIALANLPDHNITITDPGHTHTYNQPFAPVNVAQGGLVGLAQSSTNTGSSTTGITAAFGNTARGGAQTAMDFAVQYLDVVVCTKD